MADNQKHGLTPQNALEFHQKLTSLLQEFSAHPGGSTIELKTGNLKFKSEDLSGCRPECVRTAEVCDKDGKNCHIETWCECDD
jgi:hypothetical protein